MSNKKNWLKPQTDAEYRAMSDEDRREERLQIQELLFLLLTEQSEIESDSAQRNERGQHEHITWVSSRDE